MKDKEDNKTKAFKVTVRDGDKELSIEIPLGERSQIGMEKDGTGYRALQIVEELVYRIKQM